MDNSGIKKEENIESMANDDYGRKTIRLNPNARCDTGGKTTVLNVKSQLTKKN